jgi:hypothetical protein
VCVTGVLGNWWEVGLELGLGFGIGNEGISGK